MPQKQAPHDQKTHRGETKSLSLRHLPEYSIHVKEPRNEHALDPCRGQEMVRRPREAWPAVGKPFQIGYNIDDIRRLLYETALWPRATGSQGT